MMATRSDSDRAELQEDTEVTEFISADVDVITCEEINELENMVTMTTVRPSHSSDNITGMNREENK